MVSAVIRTRCKLSVHKKSRQNAGFSSVITRSAPTLIHRFGRILAFDSGIGQSQGSANIAGLNTLRHCT